MHHTFLFSVLFIHKKYAHRAVLEATKRNCARNRAGETIKCCEIEVPKQVLGAYQKHIPCKFTVQVVLFPRSSTTTAVGAAMGDQTRSPPTTPNSPDSTQRSGTQTNGLVVMLWSCTRFTLFILKYNCYFRKQYFDNVQRRI